MPTTKVTRNYQVTIPIDIQNRAAIQRGDILEVEYDEGSGAIRLLPPKKGARKVAGLGGRIGLKEIEDAISNGMRESLRQWTPIRLSSKPSGRKFF
jgi:AbrB family looped-hinge helix DNA binding protein